MQEGHEVEGAPGFRSSEQEVLVSAWERADGSVWGEVFRNTESYRILLSSLCEFTFDLSGNDPRCTLFDGTSESDARHLFSVNIVPLILGLQGISVFHASCVRFDDVGAVFMGASGRGKSTLTASFGLRGYPFLADDVLVVEPGTPPVARADNNAIRLWESSVEGLFPNGHHTERYATYSQKRRVSGDAVLKHAPGTTPLAAAFVLGEEAADGAVRVQPLDGAALHWHWMNNMFVLDAKRDDVVPRLFDAAVRIASRVPTYVIEYPREFDKLQEVRQSIIEIVERARNEDLV